MTESIALKILEKYIKNHQYNPKRLDPNDFPAGSKVPDYEISDEDKLRFYCELKSPNLNQNKKTGMFHWTTTISKLRDMVHKAVKQFKDHDPDHALPWVLVFTSDHMQLNWTSLAHAINGAVGFGDTLIKDLRNTELVDRTKADIEQVDLIIWCQVNSKDERIYQYVPFINKESTLKTSVEEISSNLKPSEEDNIVNRNSKKYT